MTTHFSLHVICLHNTRVRPLDRTTETELKNVKKKLNGFVQLQMKLYRILRNMFGENQCNILFNSWRAEMRFWHTCILWSILYVPPTPAITCRLLYILNNFLLKFPSMAPCPTSQHILSLKSSLKRHEKFMRYAIYILHFVANHFQMAVYPYLSLSFSLIQDHKSHHPWTFHNSATLLILLMNSNLLQFIF